MLVTEITAQSIDEALKMILINLEMDPTQITILT